MNHNETPSKRGKKGEEQIGDERKGDERGWGRKKKKHQMISRRNRSVFLGRGKIELKGGGEAQPSKP